MIVYVTTQGAQIVREGRHLLVRKEEDICHTLFPDRLEQLILCGSVSLTPNALNLLLSKGIDTVFLRVDGRYKGRLATSESKNVFLRKRQFELCSDAPASLSIARSIVCGKLLNTSTIVSRIKRTSPRSQANRVLADLARTIDSIAKARSIEELHGLEGAAAARYFTVFGEGLKNRHGFSRRVRRPPTDPVNAVLSLLYTCLINRAYAAVRLAGLDPYPGFLHSLDYGRFSLPLDLVEEFRAPVADTLTLALFNLNVLRAEHFERHLPEEPEEVPCAENTSAEIERVVRATQPQPVIDGCQEKDTFDMPPQTQQADAADVPTGKPAVLLKQDAYRKVIEAFEKKMNTDLYHAPAGRRLTFAEIMVFQARHLRKVIEGESAVYHSFQLK